VAELWARVTGKPGIISREKIREAQCGYWTCDTRRATEEIGFTAATGIEAGLAETLAWYKGAGWL
jgi:nucleoside-diphosphate-sugar epimerase